MNTIKMKKHPTIPMERLLFRGLCNDNSGGHVLYFQLSGSAIYRYYVTSQRWECVVFVDNANPYVGQGCMECDGNCD